jgi:two-component system, NtrC family, sensor kinase
MTTELLIAFLIALRLRRSFKTKTMLPLWDKIFIGLMGVSVALFITENSIHAATPFVQWIAYILVFGVFGIIYFNEIFRRERPLLIALLPLVIIGLIGDIIASIDRDVYKEWDNAFDAIKAFAIIWMGTMLIINSRQRKALEKERQKTLEEERQNKLMLSLKDELEVQVAERTTALTKQKEELELALAELKATQAQLIQSEKLASLGELTAGIAHEIQNPLNFVNNFSEVNTELIEEMKLEIEKGNMEEVKAIANDIKENELKISHHGRRADGIVKGMLQHSRSSNGLKEPVNLNALADEYLRLAYHGLRAKDKTFNASMKTYFDSKIGTINMIPQDMGRVILNLITNAFYAVTEKKKRLLATEGKPEGKADTVKDDKEQHYEPTVYLSTKVIKDKVLITVRDNGDGVPQKVLDKIFQPFFTTKPTGAGTGLGLSLSYDIIKAHGGKLRVDTKENEYAAFIIELPFG